jgi:23S rRNA (uridine2552-2'-O)-methyltransferase
MANYDRKDRFYELAKQQGRRSRAFFKLKELNQHYAFISPGGKILDLGAWPGSWLEYAATVVGRSGAVVGIDLQEIEPLENRKQVHLLTGDVREEQNINAALEFAGDRFDAVISDMSPSLTGIREVDSWAARSLAELAFSVAEVALRPGGTLVIKVFKSSEIDQFYRSIQQRFGKLIRKELKSTRKTSNEFYIVGREFKG